MPQEVDEAVRRERARVRSRQYYKKHRDAILAAERAKRRAAGKSQRRRYATEAERQEARREHQKAYYLSRREATLAAAWETRNKVGAFVAHCGAFHQVTHLPFACPACQKVVLCTIGGAHHVH